VSFVAVSVVVAGVVVVADESVTAVLSLLPVAFCDVLQPVAIEAMIAVANATLNIFFFMVTDFECSFITHNYLILLALLFHYNVTMLWQAVITTVYAYLNS
jgi:hypothetical protein